MGPRRSGQSLDRKPRGTFNPGMAQKVGDPPSKHSSSNTVFRGWCLYVMLQTQATKHFAQENGGGGTPSRMSGSGARSPISASENFDTFVLLLKYHLEQDEPLQSKLSSPSSDVFHRKVASLLQSDGLNRWGNIQVLVPLFNLSHFSGGGVR